MVGLKRIAAFVVAVVGLTLAAGSASALSSVDVIWKTSGTDSTSATSGNVTALIVLQGDTTIGVGGVFVSVLYDAGELTFVSALEHSGGASKVSMGNQFAPVTAGVDGSTPGTILGFDAGVGASTGCLGCTVTLGSVIFTVATLSDSDGPNDVRLTVLPNGIDGLTSAKAGSLGGVSSPPENYEFGDAEIVPEPTTALLVVGGLLGLGYAGRRSAR